MRELDVKQVCLSASVLYKWNGIEWNGIRVFSLVSMKHLKASQYLVIVKELSDWLSNAQRLLLCEMPKLKQANKGSGFWHPTQC